MSDVEFVDGPYIDPPNDRAPDFVKCKISINKNKLMAWLDNKDANAKGYINLDVKVARSGNWYASVDNWEPDPDYQRSAPAPEKSAREQMQEDGIDDDDIPF